MAGDKRSNMEPRINNRRALHEYFIEAKIECGIVLVGSEVKVWVAPDADSKAAIDAHRKTQEAEEAARAASEAAE